MEKNPRKGLHSVLWKITAVMAMCILLLLLFNWLLNNFVLQSFYTRQKAQGLEDAYAAADRLIQEDDGTFRQTMDDLAQNSNIFTLIWNTHHMVYDFQNRAIAVIQVPNYDLSPGTYQVMEEEKTLSIPEDYLQARSIKLYGRLHSGEYILIQTPVAAIEESIGISNRFLLISGAVTLLISVLIVSIAARSLTRPIRRLSHLAQNVARLDFSERYTGRGKDELADLGNSLNVMSDTLERTIRELQAANDRLSRDVEEKTRQNEARRAFISNVSHELKTPIALMQTYAEGLREDIAAGAGNREYYCEVIEDESQKMSMMIKKMTLLMQLEDGSSQLETEPFDITELLCNLMQKNAILFEEKRARIQPPANRPVYVRADAFLIENVLSNYLSNALHHVRDGGVVSGAIRKVGDNRVRISVYNDGDCIPSADLPHIWESFYKVDKARTRAYGGTGIGLSVVAAVMRAHGMPYGVFNRPDGEQSGVEFYIELEQSEPLSEHGEEDGT